MNRLPLPVSERLRRARRDLEEYRRRSLFRRSQGPRFYRYLGVVPHVFLRDGAVRFARLRAPREAVIDALRGRATWTLDTAARLRFGVGLLRSGDLQAYLESDRDLGDLGRRGLIGDTETGGASLDPVAPRAPLLIAHVTTAMPPPRPLGTGDLVVTDERLVRDVLGTLGWRPDLLARLEARGLKRGVESPEDLR